MTITARNLRSTVQKKLCINVLETNCYLGTWTGLTSSSTLISFVRLRLSSCDERPPSPSDSVSRSLWLLYELFRLLSCREVLKPGDETPYLKSDQSLVTASLGIIVSSLVTYAVGGRFSFGLLFWKVKGNCELCT